MNAPEIIREVERASGWIGIDGDDLILRADHPLDRGLVDRVRQHKQDVIEALESDLSPWRNLPLSDLEEMDVAIQIQSNVFGDLWLVSCEGSRRLTDTDDPVYTVPEARMMIGLPEELVRQIHSFKKTFGVVIEDVQPEEGQL